MIERLQPGSYRAALKLGAVIALGLGVLRGAAQIVAQNAYTRPLSMVWLMALTSIIWLPTPLVVQRLLLAELRPRRRWLGLVAFAIVVSALEPVWFFGVLHLVANWHPRGAYWVNAALRLDTNLLTVGAVVGWLWLRQVHDRREAAAERAIVLRSRASSAELDVLTMQLQPHFLFNTLNLVSQLAYESTARARRAIANLRRLLEESVAPGRGATVTLREELRFLEAYLDLQRDRFGARLHARVVADVELLDARVPRMLLQPIVENAIRHGIAPRKSGGAVDVHVRRAPGGRVSIEVADDGIGLNRDDRREGMGLANVRHRLEQLYGGETTVALSERTGGGTTTRLEFPLDTREAIDTSDTDGDATIGRTGDEPAGDTSAGLRALFIVVGWGLIAAIWSELEAIIPIASHRPVPWTALLSNNLLIAGVWVALTPLTLRLADRVAARRWSERLAAHAGGAITFVGVHLFATGLLMRLVIHADDAAVRDFRTSWAIWDVTAYFVLVAIGETMAARARLREQRDEASRAAERLAVARVALLRLHLQPSLLLSAIDAVDAAIGDPVRCETTITRLGDVLRSLLATGGSTEATLRDELALVESYAAVVGRELTIAIDDAADTSATIPPVVLCSLAATTGEPPLHLHVHNDGGRLMIELMIDGPVELPADTLANTEKRLAALYGSDHAVYLVRRDERSSIVLELPCRVAAPNAIAIPALAELAIA